ncbi:MAG: Calx-beta domain-containing protein [Acidobacteriota bacterium]
MKTTPRPAFRVLYRSPPSVPALVRHAPQTPRVLQRWFACLALAAAAAGAPPLQATVPFGGQNTIQSATKAGDVLAGDLDGDGVPDLAGLDDGAVRYLLNGGDGSTWTNVTLNTNVGWPRQLEIDDLDGDGDNDIVYTDWETSRVHWFRNNGGGSFSGRLTVGTVSRADGLDAVDFDGDTDIDLLVTSRRDGRYFWFENRNGLGTSWSRHEIQDRLAGPEAVKAADIDGDGDLDVIGGGTEDGGQLVWIENTVGDRSEWAVRTIDPAGWFTAVLGADVDLDGDLDVVIQETNADPPGSAFDAVVWFENLDGKGGDWLEHAIGPAGRNAHKGLQVVDLDYDGDLDVVANRNGRWFENADGGGTTWVEHFITVVDDIVDHDLADFDGDGDLDFAAARFTTNRFSWYENQTCSAGDLDTDSDGFRDACDVCDGFDDAIDSDGDTVPDGCDVCAGGDDRVDVDGEGTPDPCQAVATLAIDDVSAAEGDAGTTDFTFTVTLTGASPEAFAVDFATVDGSATVDDGDYTAAAGTLVFTGFDGETATATVSVAGDAAPEGDETFSVELDNLTSFFVELTDDVGVGTVEEDDVSLSISDVTADEGDTGSVDFIFTVTLAGDVAGGFTVGVATADGTATAASGDYDAVAATLTFDGVNGESETFTVSVDGDAFLEDNETFTVTLGAPSDPSVGVPDPVGLGTITNDDAASISINDVTAAEGDAGTVNFGFTVTLTGDVQDSFTVDVATQDGTATVASGDYAAAGDTLSFVGIDGETEILVVSVAGDDRLEPDETFSVALGTPTNGLVAVTAGTGTGTVQNDDVASLSITDVAAAEGDAGTTDFTFLVTLTGATDGAFTVGAATADGSATAASGDYAPASETLAFTGGDGETESVTVSVAGDTVLESDETFFVLLGSPSNPGVDLADGTGLGHITNDDLVSLAIDDVSVIEGDAGDVELLFTATLTGDADGAFTVDVATQDGTATSASGDYTAANATLSFAGTSGETETFTVTASGDSVVEDDETFTVRLGTPSDGRITVADGAGTGTLENDDGATISIADVAGAEGDAGVTDFVFSVTLNGAVEGGFTVAAEARDGTATEGSGDYVETAATLTFSGTDGEVESFTIPVAGDTAVESDELFLVLLGAPSQSGVSAADGSATGTIENDDTASLRIDDVSVTEDDAGTTDLTFSVTLTGDVEGGFTVSAATEDGTATAAGGDYVATAQTLTFSGDDGEVESFTVGVAGDTVLEEDETFSARLGAPSAAAVTLDDGLGAGTILDDDSASISIGDAVVTEGDAGPSTLLFTVTLAGDVEGGFTVPVSTADGSAAAPADYTATSQVLAFIGIDGETQNFSVAVTGDTVVEANEGLTALLGAPSLASVTVDAGTGAGTILNDDTAALSINDVSLDEGDADTADFTFTVTLAGEVDGGFTVAASTQDNTAQVGDGDYAAASETLTFAGADGETQSFTVAVAGDLRVESDESFFALLASPSNGDVALADGSGLGTVVNDDEATLSISDVSAAEGDSGATAFEFTVTLSGDVDGGFLVGYATRDGTATAADGDYDPAADFLTFTGDDGETRTLSVTVNGDGVDEGDESFFVDLDSVSNPLISFADAVGEGTVLDDDLLLSITVDGLGNVLSDPAGLDCGDGGVDCDEVYAEGITVTLTANAAVGWSFDGFSGDPDCDDGVITVVADTACVATFTAQSELTVEFVGEGFAVVMSIPEGLDCDPTGATVCAALFDVGTPVELAVETDIDTRFDGFTGDADCEDGSVLFTGADQSLTCTANIALDPPFFFDGFESGDTTAWSDTVGLATVPPVAPVAP